MSEKSRRFLAMLDQELGLSAASSPSQQENLAPLPSSSITASSSSSSSSSSPAFFKAASANFTTFSPPASSTPQPQQPACMLITSLNALQYAFPGEEAGGWSEMRMDLLTAKRGVTSKACTETWFKNHYRWVVWKHACVARKYPDTHADWFTFESVREKMFQRYQKELVRAARSCLKLVLEQDMSCQRFMVLCVARVYGPGCDYHLELTDGWYGIPCELDEELQAALDKGKIFVGLKLRIVNAELKGKTEPSDPLEQLDEFADKTWLKLSSSSTRRAKGSAKLGFQRRMTFLTNFKSLWLGKGRAPWVRGLVTRVDSTMFMQRAEKTTAAADGKATGGGGNSHRNQAAHDKAMDVMQKSMQARMEDFIKLHPTADMEAMTRARDEIRRTHMLDVSTYFRFELHEVYPWSHRTTHATADGASDAAIFTGSKCFVTVWNKPRLADELREGSFVDVTNLSTYRGSVSTNDLQLSTTKSTTIKPVPKTKLPKLIDVGLLSARCRSPSLAIAGVSKYSEFDFVGVLVSTEKYDNGVCKLFLLSNRSNALIAIDVNHDPNVLHNTRSLARTPFQPVCLCNIVCVQHDKPRDIFLCKTTSQSKLMTRFKMPYGHDPSVKFHPMNALKAEFDQLLRWGKSTSGNQVLRMAALDVARMLDNKVQWRESISTSDLCSNVDRMKTHLTLPEDCSSYADPDGFVFLKHAVQCDARVLLHTLAEQKRLEAKRQSDEDAKRSKSLFNSKLFAKRRVSLLAHNTSVAAPAQEAALDAVRLLRLMNFRICLAIEDQETMQSMPVTMSAVSLYALLSSDVEFVSPEFEWVRRFVFSGEVLPQTESVPAAFTAQRMQWMQSVAGLLGWQLDPLPAEEVQVCLFLFAVACASVITQPLSDSDLANLSETLAVHSSVLRESIICGIGQNEMPLLFAPEEWTVVVAKFDVLVNLPQVTVTLGLDEQGSRLAIIN
jgi:hypothetical protein